MPDYCLDADRVYTFESYSPSVYVLTHEPTESEGPSLPFGFGGHRPQSELSPRERWERWFA